MEHLTITKADLETVLTQWIIEFREGGTITQAEADSLPPGELARLQTEHLWLKLSAQLN